MIQSMTGYGKVTRNYPEKNITVEIKTLNSRQTDIFTHLPAVYRNNDLAIRKSLIQQLVRGKIDITLSIEDFTGEAYPDVNKPAVRHYLSQLRETGKELGILSEEAMIQAMFRWPEVLTDTVRDINEDEWKEIEETLNEAISQVKQFRAQEGKSIEADMRSHVKAILTLLDEIAPFEEERISSIRERLEKNLNSLSWLKAADRERFEQEIVYYLDKLDITEEKVRLSNHCRYFLETLDADEPTGRKLGFIVQEMGREINTLGSKANHAGIQKRVVLMKDELEKIKEQTFNVL